MVYKNNELKKLFTILSFLTALITNAQTITDPWATLGASNIQTSFIVMDASNNLYVTNFINSTISKITPSGTVTQAWATLAANSRPYGITIDASGNLYTVNRNSPYTVSKITPTSDGSSGTVIQTWATIGAEAYSITVDAFGNIFVPYVSTNKIAKIVPANGGASGTITNPWVTLATGANPYSISFDASGNLYTANSNNTISKITPAGSVTQVWATLAASSNPQFMVFDGNGNLYVSCWGTSTVSKINTSGTVTNVWSVGTNVWPAGIVLDAAGNIFTANYNNATISKITSSGAVTQAYASLATGSYPFYLAKDAAGNLYNTNMGNGTVSKLTPLSVTITSSASGVICPGTNVIFTATPTGISSPSYQWYKNGVAINGATASTYTTNSLTNNDVIKASVGDVIVSNGLIQNLDANNASSYTSGNTWTDLTGNGNNGTINTMSTGSVSIATEVAIKSFNYTKGLSYISAPITKSASMTFNIWAKTSNLTNYNAPGTMLFNAGASGTGPLTGGPDLFITGNKIYWNTYDAAGNPFKLNGTDITITTASINDNNWHNFTVVDNSVDNTASLYIDGVLKGVAAYKAPSAYSPTALFIGGEGNNANITNYNLAWEGNISIFNTYNRVLTTPEVEQNFNSKAAFYGVSSSALTTSNSITVSVNSIATPSITIIGDGCINKTTLTTATGISAYQWYKDNLSITGATSNTYTPSASGVYQVQVSNGTCSTTSTATAIFSCGNDAFGKMVALTNASSIISLEGGANFGTGKDFSGKLYNTTGFTTTSGTIGSTSAILGGVISSTNAITSSIGIVYSTDASFGTYSTTTIQSNVTVGTYTSTISGLSSGTNYFTKSFIVNKAGTSYGPVINFTTSVPSIVTQGLVLNLDAGNNSSYPSTGTTWTDLSGRSNNGSLVNTVTYNSSNQGSLVFNGYENGIGPNPYVLLPTNSDFDFGTGDFTVDMWVNIKTVNDHPNFLSINVNQSSNFAALRMSYYLGNLGISHSYDNASWAAQKNTPIATNTWKNIVVSRISGQVTVYIDAISILTYSLSGSLMSTQQNLIGALSSSFTPIGFFNLSGNIAATKIYKEKGLTSDEVSTQFSLLKTRFGF